MNESSEDSDEHIPWPRINEEIKSGLAVLLRGSTGILGILITQSNKLNAYSQADQEILESFASHAAISIENALPVQAGTGTGNPGGAPQAGP